VAALLGRYRGGRLLARQVGELLRLRLHLGEELPGCVLVLHQDVARVHLRGRVEDRVLVVLCLHLLVGDGGRRLVLPHHALHHQAFAEIVHLPRDLRVLVVAGLCALGVEEVIQGQVLDELPLAVRRRQVGARRGRQALELLRDAVAGERAALVGGDDLAARRGPRRAAGALLALLADGDVVLARSGARGGGRRGAGAVRARGHHAAHRGAAPPARGGRRGRDRRGVRALRAPPRHARRHTARAARGDARRDRPPGEVARRRPRLPRGPPAHQAGRGLRRSRAARSPRPAAAPDTSISQSLALAPRPGTHHWWSSSLP